MIRSSHTRRGRAAAAIAVAALAVAATSMAAHASSPPTAPAGSAGPSGGTLAFGITTDPDTLFPWKATQFQAVNLLQNIYGTLTEFDQDLNVVPGLATSWDTSDDGLTVTLHLRDGVVFDDGSAFDSADVVDSLTKIQDEATAAVAASTLANVTGIDAPDPSTVVLTLSAPDAALIAGLASVNIAMLSSDDTEDALNTTPNGTGPVRLRLAGAGAVDHARRQRQLLGRRADARSDRLPRDPRGVVDRVGAAVGQRADGGAQRPARRPDRRGRRRHGRGDAAAQLPRTDAQRHDAATSPTSTCASPSSAPSTAKRCSTRRRSARARSPARSRRRPTAPTRNSRPCPDTRSRQGGRVPRRRRQAGRRHDPHHRVAGRVRHVGERGAEPPGPAGRRQHHPRPRDPRVGRVRRPLDRRRLRRRGGAERRPARPRRHVRPLLHEHRQPQHGRRLQLGHARRAVRRGQGDQRPRRAGADLHRRSPTSWRTTPCGSGCSPATRTPPRRRTSPGSSR